MLLFLFVLFVFFFCFVVVVVVVVVFLLLLLFFVVVFFVCVFFLFFFVVFFFFLFFLLLFFLLLFYFIFFFFFVCVVVFSSKIRILSFPTIDNHSYCLGMTSISLNSCVLECLRSIWQESFGGWIMGEWPVWGPGGRVTAIRGRMTAIVWETL